MSLFFFTKRDKIPEVFRQALRTSAAVEQFDMITAGLADQNVITSGDQRYEVIMEPEIAIAPERPRPAER